MVVSSVTTPSVASSMSSTTWVMRMWRRAMTTLIFSAMSRVFPLRRMPAVSMKIYSVPWWITAWSTESRVVPATGDTMARSSPVRALSRVDLPTFGRPMMATLIPAGAGGSSTGASPRANPPVTRSSRASTPMPCSAETGNTSAMPSPKNSFVRPSRICESILLTARETGLPRRLSIRARSRSLPVISARPSTRKMMWSAVFRTNSAWRRICPGMYSWSCTTMPPVSISSKRGPSCSAAPCIRPRVMPGSSPTMERRCPVMRLKRVDFPTLGLPTMTTVGRLDMLLHDSRGGNCALSHGRSVRLSRFCELPVAPRACKWHNLHDSDVWPGKCLSWRVQHMGPLIAFGRRAALCVCLLQLCIYATFAQSPSSPARCQVVSSPLPVRAEGLTERLGDIVLQCSGASPGTVFSGNLMLSLPVTVTNRVDDNNLTGDAVLSVDLGSDEVPTGIAGQVSGNSIAFYGISYTVPASGKLNLRISGVRAAMNQLGLTSTIPAQVTASLSTQLLVDQSQLVVAYAQRGMFSSMSSTGISCYGSPVPDTLNLPNLFDAGTAFASTRVTEGFATAFEARGAGDDTGTRFLVQYTGFPATAHVYIPDAVAGSDAPQP